MSTCISELTHTDTEYLIIMVSSYRRIFYNTGVEYSTPVSVPIPVFDIGICASLIILLYKMIIYYSSAYSVVKVFLLHRPTIF